MVKISSEEEIIQSLRSFDISQMRLLILGLPGAGKSTLARKISTTLGLRHLEADKYFWPLRNEPLSREAFRQKITDEIKEPSYVIEGHFKDLKDILIPTVTHVIQIKPAWPILIKRNFLREWQRSGFRTLHDFENSFWFLLKNGRRLQKMQEASLQNFQNWFITK